MIIFVIMRIRVLIVVRMLVPFILIMFMLIAMRIRRTSETIVVIVPVMVPMVPILHYECTCDGAYSAL